MTDGEAKCRTCRWCQARWTPGDVENSWHRYCVLRQSRELVPCPGFEREAGTEGDDD